MQIRRGSVHRKGLRGSRRSDIAGVHDRITLDVAVRQWSQHLLPGDGAAASAAASLARRVLDEGWSPRESFEIVKEMLASWSRHPSYGATLAAALPACAGPPTPGVGLGRGCPALSLATRPAASARRLVIDQLRPRDASWLMRSQSAGTLAPHVHRVWSSVPGTLDARRDTA